MIDNDIDDNKNSIKSNLIMKEDEIGREKNQIKDEIHNEANKIEK